jgi:hypothetical protein
MELSSATAHSEAALEAARVPCAEVETAYFQLTRTSFDHRRCFLELIYARTEPGRNSPDRAVLCGRALLSRVGVGGQEARASLCPSYRLISGVTLVPWTTTDTAMVVTVMVTIVEARCSGNP